MKVTGIILAGGESSRMGQDKGLVYFGDKPMILHIIEALTNVVDSIIIISNNESYNQFGFPVHRDIIANKGPVGGIYTGLQQTQTEVNLIVSCDVPLVSKNFFKWLLEKGKNAKICLPQYKDKTHQLIGVYNRSNLTRFKQCTEQNKLKLSIVNNEIGPKIINVDKEYANFDEKIFSNINTPNQLKEISDESNC